MRREIDEPTGMRVRTALGAEMEMEFSEFVAAIERGEIGSEDEVCSHIVTQDRWVRIGEMRLYREIRRGVKPGRETGEGWMK